MLTVPALAARALWMAAIAAALAACGTSPSSRPPLLTTGGEDPALCEPGMSCTTAGEYCLASGDVGCGALICANLAWSCPADGGPSPEAGELSDAEGAIEAGDRGDAAGLNDAADDLAE